MKKNLNAGIPEGHIAFDTSLLVEMLDGTQLGLELMNALVEERIVAHASRINIAEAEYIVCRKIGQANARKRVEALLSSAYLSIEEDPSIHSIASRIKCGRAISLGDCYTFAVAEATSSSPVFAFKEEELLKEIKKAPFDRAPVFLTQGEKKNDGMA